MGKEVDDLQVDLVKEGKIRFVECNMNTWREYNENNVGGESYYIYHYDGSVYQQGYFKGHSELEEEDLLHFKEFINDYFYYGYPLYIDRNHRNSESTECELAFDSGDAYFKEITY